MPEKNALLITIRNKKKNDENIEIVKKKKFERNYTTQYYKLLITS